MKKLSEIPAGSQVEIVNIDADIKLCKRLAELSFIPGEQLFVVINNPGGYVVVETNGGRFGLPREVADRIIVKELFVQPRYPCSGPRRRKHRKRWLWWRRG
ncbi:MAG: ferrous iron transport protein A [Candidatus Njordarchaeota archaeon]